MVLGAGILGLIISKRLVILPLPLNYEDMAIKRGHSRRQVWKIMLRM
jgi:hypothetical protein